MQTSAAHEACHFDMIERHSSVLDWAGMHLAAVAAALDYWRREF